MPRRGLEFHFAFYLYKWRFLLKKKNHYNNFLFAFSNMWIFTKKKSIPIIFHLHFQIWRCEELVKFCKKHCFQ